MSNRRRMAEQWDCFARSVLHPSAPPVQRHEMRRAFYAGAQAFQFLILTTMNGPNEPVSAEELEMAVDLRTELAEFTELVKAGRA